MNFVAILAYSLAFSLFDYAGYNLTLPDKTALDMYRVSQVLLQAGITYKLEKKNGWPAAIGFNILWWTWVDDFLYYGWALLFNPRNRDNRASILRGELHRVTWAWWTPAGLLAGAHRDHVVPFEILVGQSFVGVSLTFALGSL